MFVIENVANFSEIPSLVASFASASGWSVATSSDPMNFPDAVVLNRPEGSRPLELRREPQTSGLDRLTIGDPSTPGSPRAVLDNIRIGGDVNAPLAPSPTRIFLFSGTEEGHSFIAVIIEFGFNRYRAFYIGGTVIKGDYTGGEIVAANRFVNSGVNTDWPRATDNHRLLFQASAADLFNDPNDAGFVRVVHPDQTEPFLPFQIDRSNFEDIDTLFAADRALGGPFDRVNDTFVRDGQEHFAAATLLTPHNLYQSTGSPIRLRPLGHVAGSRMVNMTNLEPGQQVTVGATNWRVFPEFRKSGLSSIDQTQPNVTGSFNADESSEFWGLAFPENLLT